MSINRVNLKSALTQPKSAQSQEKSTQSQEKSTQSQSKYTFETRVFNGVPYHYAKVVVEVPSTRAYCPDYAELEVRKYPTYNGTKIIRVSVAIHDKNGEMRLGLFHPADLWSAWQDFKSAVTLIGGVL